MKPIINLVYILFTLLSLIFIGRFYYSHTIKMGNDLAKKYGRYIRLNNMK